MRIALVVPGGVDRSGERRVIPAILWLIERLARRHDVHVIVPRQEPESGSWELRGARIHNIGEAPVRPRAVATIRRLHQDRPFDVIHALWARGSGEIGLAAKWLCRRPLAVHVAGGELVWMPEIGFGTRWPWRRALVRLVLRRADAVTVSSGIMADLVRTAGVEPRRVQLGVDRGTWTPEPPRPRPASAPAGPARLVHVGSITPVKDHPTLLRAVALLVERGHAIRLDLVGVDAWDGAMRALASGLGVARHVEFHGFVPQRELVPVVRAADIMVVSSVHEAGPVAMLEAAAVGVPTVGTRVGHVRDLEPDAAVAVPVGDAAALADAIEALLADGDRWLDIAVRAQRETLAEDADRTAERFESLYEELTKGRSP